MATTIETQSTLTDRYQTTIPKPVRDALRLGKRDKIDYFIRPDGEVVLTRAEAPEKGDPVLEQFLSFLAHDMANCPERLIAIDAGLVKHLQKLVGNVEIDLDTALSVHDE